MANDRIQFPDPTVPGSSPYTDQFSQIWIWNDVAWVRRGAEPGVPEAPKDSQQYARIHYYDKPNPLYPGTDPTTGQPEPEFIVVGAEWTLVQADEWYLGAYATAPDVDNYGNGLVEGHTYYNTEDKTMYVFNSLTWSAFSGVSEIATLWEYRFDNVNLETAGDGTAIIVDVAAGDDHNNTPYDAWERGTIIVTVYVDDARMVERRDLTPAFGDPSNPVPARPSDEENQIQVANEAALPTLPDVGVAGIPYITVDNGYCWITPDGTTAWARGGAELDRYDYTVDYENQTIRIMQNFTATSKVVIETGTLAASEYIKQSQENAADWAFVKSDCDMGGETPDPTKLVVESAIKCYVDAAVEAGLSKATNAAIGACFPYAGSTPPPNAVACNNQEMSISAYPIAYARVGTTWNNFNGIDSPSGGNFRAPPQEASGYPLYYGGSMGATPIGSFLPGQNKEHSHVNSHSHTGTVSSSTGSHEHYTYWHTSSVQAVSGKGGKTIIDRLISKSTYDNGEKSDPINNHRVNGETVNAGVSGTNVNISETNAATGAEGGPANRPNTAIMLMCMWADIQS